MPTGLIIVANTRSPPIAKLPRNEISPEDSTSETNYTRNKPGDEPDPFLHKSNRKIFSGTNNALEGDFSAEFQNPIKGK
jgi:hypothetical protein